MELDQAPKIEKVRIYSIITLALIITGSAISLYVANRIDHYTTELVHTEKILQRTNEIYTSILERETNVRGYILTGDDDFLINYENSKIIGNELINYLKDLTSDNPTQQKYLSELELQMEIRLDVFERSIEHFQQNRSLVGFISQEKVDNAVNGYRNIKNLMNKINEEENRLLLTRNQILINNIAALPMITGLISFLSVMMGLLTLFSLFHYNKFSKLNNDRIKNYQENLKDKIELLHESNNELKQFAYIASHDLQEPLRKITSFSDLLTEQFQGKLGEEGNHYLSRISASAYRMRRLITDLLEYSRAGRDSDESVKTIPLDLIVSSVLEDMEVVIKETGALITYSDLPEVEGRETEMRQVFQNLISNSLKFIKEGTVPEITISSQIPDRSLIENHLQLDLYMPYLMIRFEDNGIGFDQNYADRIFTIFQRLHGKNEYEGTGIGLAITRKIIEKNRGVIFAESAPTGGATFIIILPRPLSN